MLKHISLFKKYCYTNFLYTNLYGKYFYENFHLLHKFSSPKIFLYKFVVLKEIFATALWMLLLGCQQVFAGVFFFLVLLASFWFLCCACSWQLFVCSVPGLLMLLTLEWLLVIFADSKKKRNFCFSLFFFFCSFLQLFSGR